MRAELKNRSSLDVDLENYVPDNPRLFCFFLEAVIGLEGKGSGETFLM